MEETLPRTFQLIVLNQLSTPEGGREGGRGGGRREGGREGGREWGEEGGEGGRERDEMTSLRTSSCRLTPGGFP